jgi:hypothetical protein
MFTFIIKNCILSVQILVHEKKNKLKEISVQFCSFIQSIYEQNERNKKAVLNWCTD